MARRRALLGLVVAGLAVPAAVAAHLALRAATPGDGASLDAAPAAIRLEFTQAVELALSTVELAGPNGPVELAAPRAADDGRTVVADVTGPLSAGGYTVRWQVVGPDGHPIRGEYAFAIAEGAEGLAAPAAPDPGAAAASEPEAAAGAGGATADARENPVREFDASSPLYVAVRWLGYAGILGVIGAVAFRLIVLPTAGRMGTVGPDAAARLGARAARAGAWLAGVTLVAALLRLQAQTIAVYGGMAAPGGGYGTLVFGTGWGTGWIVQMAGALTALVGLVAARGGRSGWVIASLAVPALAVAPALSGHAAAAQGLGPAPVIAHALHILAVGGWLGTLLVLAGVALPEALRGQDGLGGAVVAGLVHAFSPAALGFAAVALLTGVFATWLHVGTPALLIGTAYGRALVVKLAVLIGVFAAGAYNFRRIRPALGDVAAVGRLRRSSAVELGLTAVVLLVTAVLVAQPRPREDAETAAAEPPVSATAAAPELAP